MVQAITGAAPPRVAHLGPVAPNDGDGDGAAAPVRLPMPQDSATISPEARRLAAADSGGG